MNTDKSSENPIMHDKTFPGRKTHSNLNQRWPMYCSLGGIIPPVARALHETNIERVVDEALASAGVCGRDLQAVAVTVKPGLPLSLTVGLEHAKKLCRQWQKPLIPVHHMEAHALTIRMVQQVTKRTHFVFDRSTQMVYIYLKRRKVNISCSAYKKLCPWTLSITLFSFFNDFNPSDTSTCKILDLCYEKNLWLYSTILHDYFYM